MGLNEKEKEITVTKYFSLSCTLVHRQYHLSLTVSKTGSNVSNLQMRNGVLEK